MQATFGPSFRRRPSASAAPAAVTATEPDDAEEGLCPDRRRRLSEAMSCMYVAPERSILLNASEGSRTKEGKMSLLKSIKKTLNTVHAEDEGAPATIVSPTDCGPNSERYKAVVPIGKGARAPSRGPPSERRGTSRGGSRERRASEGRSTSTERRPRDPFRPSTSAADASVTPLGVATDDENAAAPPNTCICRNPNRRSAGSVSDVSSAASAANEPHTPSQSNALAALVGVSFPPALHDTHGRVLRSPSVSPSRSHHSDEDNTTTPRVASPTPAASASASSSDVSSMSNASNSSVTSMTSERNSDRSSVSGCVCGAGQPPATPAASRPAPAAINGKQSPGASVKALSPTPDRTHPRLFSDASYRSASLARSDTIHEEDEDGDETEATMDATTERRHPPPPASPRAHPTSHMIALNAMHLPHAKHMADALPADFGDDLGGAPLASRATEPPRAVYTTEELYASGDVGGAPLHKAQSDNGALTQVTSRGSLKFAPLPPGRRAHRSNSLSLGVASRARMIAQQQSAQQYAQHMRYAGPDYDYDYDCDNDMYLPRYTYGPHQDVYTYKDVQRGIGKLWKKVSKKKDAASAETAEGTADEKESKHTIEHIEDAKPAVAVPQAPLIMAVQSAT